MENKKLINQELLGDAIRLISEGKEELITEEQWELIRPLREKDNENQLNQTKDIFAYDICTNTGNIHIPMEEQKGLSQTFKIVTKHGLEFSVSEFVDKGLWKEYNKDLTIICVVDRDVEFWEEVDYKTKETRKLHLEDEYFIPKLDCIRKIKRTLSK